ncbi:Photosystem I chlorophyll a apoprotein A2 [Capsicum baccatum]|uniref:Photosystem I chlorophyll a apoprotein A2 n=1 Tax=Capsicum baccatum TaxID=33114 RepID=A0A2G2WAX5_CAPBA|nr:Photosystem I chlorophyll a apoprotein A2 [Capsicum baccatum]
MLNTFNFFPSASATVTAPVPAEALSVVAVKVLVVVPAKPVVASADDPLHVRPIAHAIWDPHFGQSVVETFTRGGALGPVNIGYSSVYQWWLVTPITEKETEHFLVQKCRISSESLFDRTFCRKFLGLDKAFGPCFYSCIQREAGKHLETKERFQAQFKQRRAETCTTEERTASGKEAEIKSRDEARESFRKIHLAFRIAVSSGSQSSEKASASSSQN